MGRLGKLQEAEKQFEKALSLDPNNPKINFFLRILIDWADRQEAKRQLKKALNQRPIMV